MYYFPQYDTRIGNYPWVITHCLTFWRNEVQVREGRMCHSAVAIDFLMIGPKGQ